MNRRNKINKHNKAFKIRINQGNSLKSTKPRESPVKRLHFLKAVQALFFVYKQLQNAVVGMFSPAD